MAPDDDHGAGAVTFEVDGRVVSVTDDGTPLSEVLRDRLGLLSVKDGCSPQGQCGCCTVLVDGKPRVSCVTPLRRVAGRRIETVDGLAEESRAAWAEAFVAAGASQCGFCSPGIVVRLEGLRRERPDADIARVRRALAAHMCRCTGWQTIEEAWRRRVSGEPPLSRTPEQLEAAELRATLEAGVPQRVGPRVVLGDGGFADDSAPAEAVVAVRRPADGQWLTAPSLTAARRRAGAVPGRRSTMTPVPPLELPDGDWMRTLRTSWVDGAYLELDASWCVPGGQPISPRSNGGGFGAKTESPVPAVARRLADELGTAVRVRASRDDAVRFGVKRAPVAIGLRADGSGTVRVGLGAAHRDDAVACVAGVHAGLDVDVVELSGPPTSLTPRGSLWLEVAVAIASLGSDPSPEFRAPGAGTASVRLDTTSGAPRLIVTVDAGEPLDEVVLRSYAIGAVHMGWSLVTSESISVVDGEPTDLTIRSLGVLPAGLLPPIDVEIGESAGPAVPVGASVMAAAAHLAWRLAGWAPQWPTGEVWRARLDP